MSLLSVMRRWYFRDGLSQREITRRTGLSRNTVPRYLKNDITEPIYPKRDSLGKVKAFEELLISWLKREARRRRKERKTVKNLYEDLLPMGYSGSLEFAAGETFQFDWGENYALIDGRKTKLQVAHFKLSRSRAYILRAYPAQSHETNYNDCLVNSVRHKVRLGLLQSAFIDIKPPLA